MTRTRPGDRDRRRTPARGVPSEIDSELTPPPQEPPRPETFPDYDTISAPVQRQLETLADGLGQVTEALGKVWDARRDGDKLERIDEKLGTLAKCATEHEMMLREFVVPGLKGVMARTDELMQKWPVTAAAMEQTAKAVDNMVERLVRLEQSMQRQELEARSRDERVTGTIGNLESRLQAVAARTDTHDARITALEVKNRDERVATTAISKRDKKLIGWASAAGVVVTFLVTQAKTIWGWFH